MRACPCTSLSNWSAETLSRSRATASRSSTGSTGIVISGDVGAIKPDRARSSTISRTNMDWIPERRCSSTTARGTSRRPHGFGWSRSVGDGPALRGDLVKSQAEPAGWQAAVEAATLPGVEATILRQSADDAGTCAPVPTTVACYRAAKEGLWSSLGLPRPSVACESRGAARKSASRSSALGRRCCSSTAPPRAGAEPGGSRRSSARHALPPPRPSRHRPERPPPPTDPGSPNPVALADTLVVEGHEQPGRQIG